MSSLVTVKSIPCVTLQASGIIISLAFFPEVHSISIQNFLTGSTIRSTSKTSAIDDKYARVSSRSFEM